MGDNRPIGVFDSGVGGVSILMRLKERFPDESFVYFGDSKNAPFGTKSRDELIPICENIVNFLKSENCKAIVVACNTATVATLGHLREKYPDIPFVGTYPAVEEAAHDFPGQKILLLATPFTVKSERIRTLVEKVRPECEVIPIGCPGFIEFIERGEVFGPSIESHLTGLLGDVKYHEFGAVILGCTHYLFAKDAIFNVIGKALPIYDGSTKATEELGKVLVGDFRADENKNGTVEFYSSSEGNFSTELMKKLFYSANE